MYLKWFNVVNFMLRPFYHNNKKKTPKTQLSFSTSKVRQRSVGLPDSAVESGSLRSPLNWV